MPPRPLTRAALIAAIGAWAGGCYVAHGPVAEAPCEVGAACDCRAADMIPAGATIVGTDGSAICEPGDINVDTPEHIETITRDYWLGRFEATGACFRRCVEAGACTPPSRPFLLVDAAEGGADWDERWFEDPAFASYPMLPLTWQRAADYCAWLGGRLPTNAEWERALRSDDGRTYPWLEPGETIVADCEHAAWVGPATRCPENHDSRFVPVDTYPRGRGVYGHFHIAGNACEWVQDWFDCYPREDVTDWAGPESSPLGARTLRCRDQRSAGVPDREGTASGPSGISVRCVFDREPTPLRPEDEGP